MTILEDRLAAQATSSSGPRARGASPRAPRRCARCGREGRNAFRQVQADVGATMWVCTHEEPCIERTRMLRRAAARAAQGRPAQSPIGGFSWEARRACVIGSDPASRKAIATALEELGSIEVERLELTRRSVEMLGCRDFGLVVADVRAGDQIALLGGLARRLSAAVGRGVPVVVVHGGQDAELPAIASLVRQCGGSRLSRPIQPAALLTMVNAFVGLSPAGSVGRAAS